MKIDKLREIALEMILAGVKSADPERLVREAITLDKGTLIIDDSIFNLADYDHILLFGIGKASVPMASAFMMLDIDDGLVLTNNKVPEQKNCPVPIRVVEHPYPSKKNLDASQELLSKLDEVKDALIIFLVSGGGSSMFTLSAEDISIKDINKLNRLLVTSGMGIHEINTVRKHVSQVKGGRFAKMCENRGTLISLIISDVVDDDISSVASGPTCADHTTYEDSVRLLKGWELWDRVPAAVREHLERGLAGDVKETPYEVKAVNLLVGSNITALEGMKRCGEENGIPSIILTSKNVGEAKCTAKNMMDIAKKIRDNGMPYEPPIALILGGEMTVKFDKDISEENLGGPNREFVLEAAIQIKGRDNMVVASVDSDGVDGRGKAGAIADGESVRRSSMDAKTCLEEHRSQEFFDHMGDSIELESETNVNDLTVIIIGKPE